MAVEMPTSRLRELAANDPVQVRALAAVAAPPFQAAPSIAALRPGVVRALEILPGALALFLISALIWGFIWFPAHLTAALLVFDTYWLWKSWTIGYHALKGVRLIRTAHRRRWCAEYERAAAAGAPVLPWDAVRHVVIIPNYKESESKLASTLETLARVVGARESVIPVLAMEAAEPDSLQKGMKLRSRFQSRFHDFLVTVHPQGLPGEVRGKSSNESWAARRATEELVGRRGIDLDHLTVTSCDADTQFPRRYFEALTYHFATDPKRYRRFWQAPIFFYNNIWQVPGPLRVPNALSGLIHLGRLSRKRRVLFSQSTYSLSMRMAHDVGYWDTDIIPEDWHMFLKCFYRLGSDVDVEPIFLPLGNDGALSTTPLRTFANHYLQVRRWGWGVSDLPYAVLQALSSDHIPWRRRLLRVWYLFDNHISWSTQWFFLTLGGVIPFLWDLTTGVQLTPDIFYLNNLTGLSFVPGWLTATSLVMTPTLIPFVILIVIDSRLRPRPPAGMTRLQTLLSHAWWLATSPISFFCSALPALDAQIRLMLGRRMEYRVTEKV
ncbi:MAG TPA: hypothetical protein VNN21_00165 [Dehalococcoidia bacterium]|nr:hypothetical protein [Dehalococcoidia bacterium]